MERKYSSGELDQYARTVVNQMGGWGKLRAMIGMWSASYDENEAHEPILQFKFKGSRTYNFCQVTLNGNDTYTLEIGQIRKKNGVPTYVVRFQEDNVYCDMLKPMFEKVTGLYLSL